MNKEYITAINEIHDFKITGANFDYDGYEIHTNLQTLYVLISNDQGCCEEWGYICPNDNTKDFIGAELHQVTKVDPSCYKTLIGKDDQYEENFIFINLETDRGTLSLGVYNHHNGYYSHYVRIISKQLSLDVSL